MPISTKKILLTCFEPFDGRTANASHQIARQIQNRPLGQKCEILCLPVERFRADALVIERLRAQKYEAVVMLGEAGGRDFVAPERRAINRDDFPIPDNAGNQPRGETIIQNGAAILNSTLPLENIVWALQNAGLPAQISDDAGMYLCNRVFYGVRAFLQSESPQTRAGFVHFPLLKDLSLEKGAQALEIILGEV